MKKRIVIPCIIILALIVLAVAYFFIPKTFGKNVNPSEVDHINVFDGNTGTGFTITDSKDIEYIVKNIQSHSMKKDGISLGRMGYSLKISYVDSNDKDIIPVFILNSDDTIRKDPFFYVCDGGLCFEYIKNLEPDLSEERLVLTYTDSEKNEISYDEANGIFIVNGISYYETGKTCIEEINDEDIKNTKLPISGGRTITAWASVDEGAVVVFIDDNWKEFILE